MRHAAVLVACALGLSWPATTHAEQWQTDAIAKALAYHAAHLPELCLPPEGSEMLPGHFELQIGEDTAARQALIVELPCQIGAYSQTAVYLLSDQHGRVSEITFPAPRIEVTYAGEGEAASVDRIDILEVPQRREVINPDYDSASRTMSERNEWREVGDAYSLTRWGFKNGKFEITYFAVDATFDGEDNPIVLIEREIW